MKVLIKQCLFYCCQKKKNDLFYTQSEEQVLSSMGSSLDGLSKVMRQTNIPGDYGRNELEEGEKLPF